MPGYRPTLRSSRSPLRRRRARKPFLIKELIKKGIWGSVTLFAFLLILINLIHFAFTFAGPAASEETKTNLEDRERTGLALYVELNRLDLSEDPAEGEAILRQIINQCEGTEEAESAYWSLASLYLDSFPEPREKEARDILELFLKRYPASRWKIQAKCRLLALYDNQKDAQAVRLRKELLNDEGLPQVLRSALKL